MYERMTKYTKTVFSFIGEFSMNGLKLGFTTTAALAASAAKPQEPFLGQKNPTGHTYYCRLLSNVNYGAKKFVI